MMILTIIESHNSLNLSDRLFLGEALFETIKIQNAIPLNVEAHWQRLKNSAAFLHIPFDLSCERWTDRLISAIRESKIANGGVKVILSAGDAPRALSELSQKPWMKLTCFAYQPNTNPLKLLSAPWQRDAKNPIYQHKTVNYLEAILASRFAKENHAHDVLFFNFEGFAQETSIANIFIIKENQLFTPALRNGLLAGIARRRLIQHCQNQGIVCHEIDLTKKNILEAEILLTTNSLQGLRLVSSLDNRYFSIAHPLLDKLNQI